MSFIQFIITACLAAFVFICFIMCIICLAKVGRLSSESENDEFSEEIRLYYEEIKKLAQINSENNAPIVMNAPKIPQGTICKTGVVHFNAFPDVTGAISFSVALIDMKNDGIILTSLYGRDASNTYIREVKNGECSIHLLDEEQEALIKALDSEVK